MLRNKYYSYRMLLMLTAVFLTVAIAVIPAEAKKNKSKETVPEVIEPAVPVEERVNAVEDIGFDPDSLFFVNPDPDEIRSGALGAILPHYNEWNTVRMNGNLRLKGLPISPSVRIFMERSKRISISVRVSLLGEVGRIEVSGDTVLGINKMKRTYCVESLKNLKYDYPDIIGDLQTLLLGRITIFQAGELAEINSDFVDFTLGDARTVGWFIDYPRGEVESDELSYRYTVDPDGLITNLLAAVSIGTNEYTLNLDYTYPSDGHDIDIHFMKDDRTKFTGTVYFGEPQWEAAPLEPVQINSRYTEMRISQFIKSFKL